MQESIISHFNDNQQTYDRLVFDHNWRSRKVLGTNLSGSPERQIGNWNGQDVRDSGIQKTCLKTK